MNKKRILLPFAVAATLYGCGGGGGGGGGSAPPELSAITEANATKSVAVAYSAAAALFDSSATSAMLITPTSLKSTARETPGAVLFSISQLRAIEGRRATGGKSDEAFSTKAPVDETEECENGGTVRMVGNVQDQEDFLLSTGDHATLTFSHCEIEGLTIDGRVAMSDVVVGAMTSARFDFSGVSFSVGGETAGLDGGFRLSMPTDADDSAPITVTLRDVSLRSTVNGQTLTLSGVAADTTFDVASGSFSYTMSGRVADSASGVSLSLATALPYAGVGDDLTAGDMTIEGAKSSRARAVVSGPNQLTISVDADGDGNFEKQFDPVNVSTLVDG